MRTKNVEKRDILQSGKEIRTEVIGRAEKRK